MTALKPYPEYKESGVPFLGAVPQSWSIQPAVTLAQVLTSTVDKHSSNEQIPVHLCNYTDVYYNDEITDLPVYMRATATSDQISSFSVTTGDVVFTKDSESADDIGISAFVPKTLPGVVYGYHLSTYRPKDSSYGKFLKWLLDSKYAKATLQTRTLGVTRVGLSQNTVRYLRVPTPPPSEAKAIADFLDRETAEIDAFIADQEELIGLLTERRAATISHAVTKGLDPSVPMKDSGVEWLGNVPTHWHVNRLSRGVKINEGQVDPEKWPYMDMVLIAPNHVEARTGRSRGFVTALEQGAESGKYLVREGQVIYSKIRPNLAKVLIAPFDCLCSADMYGLEARNPAELSNEFLRWMLLSQSFTDYAIDQSARVAMPKLNHDTLGAAPIWYPSLQEQRAIIFQLDRETAELDAAIADAREAIALSKERRAVLISAAVTGKIDVRDAAQTPAV